jgi:hypothetical protein
MNNLINKILDSCLDIVFIVAMVWVSVGVFQSAKSTAQTIKKDKKQAYLEACYNAYSKDISDPESDGLFQLKCELSYDQSLTGQASEL